MYFVVGENRDRRFHVFENKNYKVIYHFKNKSLRLFSLNCGNVLRCDNLIVVMVLFNIMSTAHSKRFFNFYFLLNFEIFVHS